MQSLIYYLLAIKALVKYNTNTPNVNFGRYFWWVFAYYKTFWWQIPKRKHDLDYIESIDDIYMLSTYQYVPAPCDVRSIPWSGL